MESTFSRFLEPRGFGTGYVPVMNEAAIEDCESWSDDEPTVSSTTASASEELQVLASDIHQMIGEYLLALWFPVADIQLFL